MSNLAETPRVLAPAGGAAPPAARPEAPTGRRGEVFLHLLVLALCLGAIAGAFLLRPAAADGEDAGLTLAGVTLPEVCTLKRVTGVPCPGCGLTRSWVAALDGRWRGSVAHHPLGWLFLLYAFAQASRHLAWLVLPRARGAVERLGRPLDRGLVVLAVLLMVAWVPVLVRVF